MKNTFANRKSDFKKRRKHIAYVRRLRRDPLFFYDECLKKGYFEKLKPGDFVQFPFRHRSSDIVGEPFSPLPYERPKHYFCELKHEFSPDLLGASIVVVSYLNGEIIKNRITIPSDGLPQKNNR